MAEGGGQERFVHDFLMTQEGLELAAAFPKIARPRVRRRVLELVRTLAEDEDATDRSRRAVGDPPQGTAHVP